MIQRWTFRCYPTQAQEKHLAREFGCARYVFNRALAERSKAFKDGRRINYAQSSANMTKWRHDKPTAWLAECSSVVQQQALRDLQAAYVNFFEKRAEYPAFRRKNGRQSIEYTKSGFRFDTERRALTIAKVGALKIKWSRPEVPEPSSLRLIRKPSGRYFVSLVVDVSVKQLPKTGESIGLDFGINRLATLSNGERVPNPKYGSHYARRMAWMQRQLARKQKGSKRRFLWKQRVANLHEKIANSRTDVQNKLALDLVRRFDTICVEDLHLRGMLKNHSLARALSDASIGSAIRKIEEKAKTHGKNVVRIDRLFPSSKMCSQCGVIQEVMPLSVRDWTCACGAVHDRDENAASNILAVGLTVTARGAGVRAKRTTVRRANLRRNVNLNTIKHVA